MLSLVRQSSALSLPVAAKAGAVGYATAHARIPSPRRRPPQLVLPAVLPPRCRTVEQYSEVMGQALGQVEEAMSQWLPNRLQGRVNLKLEKELLRWWRAMQPVDTEAAAEESEAPLSFLHRLTLCYATGRTGAFRTAFRNQLVSLPGQPVSLVTHCPLEHFGRQAKRHFAVCDLRLFYAFYGFATPGELRIALHHTLVRSLTLLNTEANPAEEVPRGADLGVPHLKSAYAMPGQQPALFAYRPGLCDWVLLHFFEDRPTVTLIAFADENRFLRAAQLPTDTQLLGLQGAVRRRYGLAEGQEVVVNHVLMPPDGLDQSSLLQLHRLVGTFLPPVERFWLQFDRPTPQDVDLEAWRSIDERDAWLTRL